MPVGPSSLALPIRMNTDLAAHDPILVRARIDEALGAITSASIDFAGPRLGMPAEDLLGQVVTLEMDTGGATPRLWHLHCTAVEYLGRQGAYSLYTAELNSWMWFLTRGRSLRIFNERKGDDIVREILEKYGLEGLMRSNLTEAHPTRIFTMQYRESDHDFVCRLMEEEGIHFATLFKDGEQQIHLADYNGGYPAMPGDNTID